MIHDSAFLALMGLQSLADHPAASGRDGVSPEFQQILKRAAREERRERQEAIDSAANVVMFSPRDTVTAEEQDETVPISKT